MTSNTDGAMAEEKYDSSLYSVHRGKGKGMAAQFSKSSTKPELIALIESLRRRLSFTEEELVYQKRLMAEKEAECKLLSEKIGQMRFRDEKYRSETAANLAKYETAIKVIEVNVGQVSNAKKFRAAVEKCLTSIH